MSVDDRRYDLAATIRARRIDLGLRQRELADLAGCSPGFLAGLESGKVAIQLDKVLAVCRVLGLDLSVTWGNGSITSSVATPDAPRQRVSTAVRRTR